MKIEITLRVTVDDDVWQEEYGTTSEGLARDVFSYVYNQVAASPAVESGAIQTVTSGKPRVTARR